MKKLFPIFICSLFLIGISSCEKDDICVEGDTPLLVIDFINVADTTQLKNVNDLRILGLGATTVPNSDTDRTDINTVSVPLRTNENTTSFLVIRNSATDDAGAETGDIDTLVLSYDRLEDFTSRACGFVVNFDNLSASLAGSADNWINKVKVIRSQVINSDSTHVQIFH
jgi:hypothetical protein